jgi:hypothetical protein
MKKYLIRVGDALSQLLNVVLFFGANANESVSGRAYRSQHSIYWFRVRQGIDWVFALFGERNHCQKAYLSDLTRASITIRQHTNYPNQ